MLVETKARVGVFSIALGAYLPQFPSLVPEFEKQFEDFKKSIPDTVEITADVTGPREFSLLRTAAEEAFLCSTTAGSAITRFITRKRCLFWERRSASTASRRTGWALPSQRRMGKKRPRSQRTLPLSFCMARSEALREHLPEVISGAAWTRPKDEKRSILHGKCCDTAGKVSDDPADCHIYVLQFPVFLL